MSVRYGTGTDFDGWHGLRLLAADSNQVVSLFWPENGNLGLWNRFHQATIRSIQFHGGYDSLLFYLPTFMCVFLRVCVCVCVCHCWLIDIRARSSYGTGFILITISRASRFFLLILPFPIFHSLSLLSSRFHLPHSMSSNFCILFENLCHHWRLMKWCWRSCAPWKRSGVWRPAPRGESEGSADQPAGSAPLAVLALDTGSAVKVQMVVPKVPKDWRVTSSWMIWKKSAKFKVSSADGCAAIAGKSSSKSTSNLLTPRVCAKGTGFYWFHFSLYSAFNCTAPQHAPVSLIYPVSFHFSFLFSHIFCHFFGIHSSVTLRVPIALLSTTSFNNNKRTRHWPFLVSCFACWRTKRKTSSSWRFSSRVSTGHLKWPPVPRSESCPAHWKHSRRYEKLN